MKKIAGKAFKYYGSIITKSLPLFITAGLLTAVSSQSGDSFSGKIYSMSQVLSYMVIPLFMGYLAGKHCGGDGGGLAGTLAASAVVMTDPAAVIAGSILAGSAAGYLYRRGMERIREKIPSGFEMLVQNLYLSIAGLVTGYLVYAVLLPVVTGGSHLVGQWLDWMVQKGLLPWISIAVEPLKILFLNNWLNHGFFVPFGMEQVQAGSSSVLFLLETNPGPGFGILAAYAIQCRREKKQIVSELVIQLFGGIHEVYFPYILEDLKLLLAAVAGGIAGNFCFLRMGSGLFGPASPGSIITLLMMGKVTAWPGILLGIGISALVSCGLACLLMGRGRKAQEIDVMKSGAAKEVDELKKKTVIETIYFICDAGMGSSAMAAALFRRKCSAMGITGLSILHAAADEIPEDADLLVCQKDFHHHLPVTGKECFQVENLTDMTCYLPLLERIKEGAAYGKV